MKQQNYAGAVPCDILTGNIDKKYDEDIRLYQGCPSVALTRGGRVFAAWYSGGDMEPHIENYNLLVMSDDDGKTFSKPILVIPTSKERLVHALDIQLWTDPNGVLHVFWVQNNIALEDTGTVPEFGYHGRWVGGYFFGDWEHAMWEVICVNPDAEVLTFSAPRRIDVGFLRNKPLVLKNGTWIYFNYDQLTPYYGYDITTDEGKTFTRYHGAKKARTIFDEAMAYEMENGTIRMLARTHSDNLAETCSTDGAMTWSETTISDIENPSARFYIARTPSGRVLLVNNDDPKKRKNMTIYLSEDDGQTWKYKYLLDTRDNISYPDVDYHNGKIYLIYDRERNIPDGGAREILFSVFTEEDVIKGNKITYRVISKGRGIVE